MTTNLLTAEQASFETGIAGWSGPPAAPPVNMLTVRQATAEGEDVLPGAAVTFRLGGWVATNGNARVGRTHALDGQATLYATWNLASAGFLTLLPGFTTSATGMHYPATPGQTFTFMASQRSDTPGKTLRLALRFFDSAGALIGTQTEAIVTAVSGQFVPGRVVATAPAGTASVGPTLSPVQTMAANNAETYYWRQAGLFLGDVQIAAWTSPADAWGRNLLDAERADVETNSINNGVGGTVQCGWQEVLAGPTRVTQVSGGLSGTHALLSNTATTTAVQLGPRDAAGQVYAFPVTAGKVYTAMFAVKCAAAIATSAGLIFLRLTWRDTTGATLSSSDLSTTEPIPAGQWVTPVLAAVAPAGAVSVIVTPWPQSLPNNTDVQFDCFGLFDGYVGAWHHPNEAQPSVPAAALASVTDPAAPDGTHVLAITRPATEAVGTVEATSTAKTAVPGRTYTGMADFASTVGRTGRVYLEFLDTGGTVVGGGIGTVQPGSGFEQALVTAVAPAGTMTVRLRLAGYSMQPSEVLRVDRAGIMDGAVTVWVPGGGTVPPNITTVPDPNRHRMEVIVRDLLNDNPVSLWRILPGGRAEPVRHAQNVTPSSGFLIVDDYDIPTDTPFQYQVRNAATDAVIVASSPTTLPSSDTFWLGEPNIGLMVRILPAANAIPTWTRDAPVGVHRVLGRQDPVVVTDRRWWAEGELTHYSLTEDQRNDVGDLYSLGTTLGLYGPQAILGGIGRIYIVAGTVNERRVSARGYEVPREWHADITQVAEPTGAASVPLVVTWAAVVAAYDTWQDVVDNEHDWLDVMTGVPGAEPSAPGTEVGWEW